MKIINEFIDHTLLKPSATATDIEKLCREAMEYKFAAVCVNSYYVKQCISLLKNSDVKVCTVVGFPLGASTFETKRFEALKAMTEGAREIDMVLNISALKSNEEGYVFEDIKSLAQLCHQQGALLKVILETCLLSDAEKVKACELAVMAKADFVKTSTGFSTSGATIEDVKLMRLTVGPTLGVKASGGIKDFATAKAMIDAGATRLGTSSGVEIVKGLVGLGPY